MLNPPLRRPRAAPPLKALLSLVSLIALAGCNTMGAPLPLSGYESFDSALHSRPFDADTARACEAARRALLSQGYVIGAATAEFVNGRKSFQPTREMHVEIDMRIVCASENSSTPGALVFVSGTEDRYTVKRTANSASVGVPAIGSLSLPFSSSEDSLVKVASRTIDVPDFYERFYALVDRYLVPEPAPQAAQ